ncbi:Hsp70 family protein [Maritalea porphyrae]|uniref:Molecular chaperone DnaK n=1 Tax=Maritalea porphyrae TaxID=880732 RepID=A0ABQ5UST6_9HYPH|nr:Hsp70 family protein [Maritalea porphyrae]GLQ18192.1 molecular chaperone DnaK [Maritalea porphyrae]
MPDANFSMGVDFGTTNTVVAFAGSTGAVRSIKFGTGDAASDVYRSVLCFQRDESGSTARTEVSGGIEAIDTYLTSANDVRFIQSIKSHAASHLFEETRIFGQSYKYENLMSAFLQCAIKEAGTELKQMPKQFVSGRPVAFVGSKPDNQLATERYERAYAQAGFSKPQHVYEPVGAAYSYAQRLKKDATVLVGDFGGGTSDFSIVHFEKRDGKTVAHPVGYSGLGIAGDRFDYRIIDAVISPKLGKYGQYKSFNKFLEMPKHYYAQFAKWHQLALLKNPQTLRELHNLAKSATEPEQVEALIETIVDDRGFDIYRAVSAAKAQLSSCESATFELKLGGIDVGDTLNVDDFNNWIAPDLVQIGETVDQLLQNTNCRAGEIDNVFLTGGSSFIPAVQRIFEQRFGRAKLASGNQFQSVAIGLALIGQERDISPWLASNTI